MPAKAQSEPNQVWTTGAVPKTDPNMLIEKEDPNTPVQVMQKSDPKSAKQTQSPISGTLALNWLYQGKEPPKPQVGNEKVTFTTEIRPWPYYCYDNDWLFYRPWLNSYEYWSRYRDNFNAYPINHAAVRMDLDASVSFEFGGYTPYDLAGPYYRP
ncbi:MAG: hypothetical protein ABFD91_17240 [Anaerohalosphaeraceae bacterium]